MLISAGSFLGLNTVSQPAIGADLQLGEIGEEPPNQIDSLTVNLTDLQIYPRYLSDTSGLSISAILSIEGNGDTDNVNSRIKSSMNDDSDIRTIIFSR